MNSLGLNRFTRWPKNITTWIQNKILYVSIPFTWLLPKTKEMLKQQSFFWNRIVIGGPAVSLMPEYFSDLSFVSVGPRFMPGILQKVNPLATKTTMGCVRSCKFCVVPKIESPYFENGFKELNNWPDLPILIDNNLFAASKKHFNRVVDRLKHHTMVIDDQGSTVDFNQGVDARLLKKHHAERISEIKSPLIRLALDSMKYNNHWESAFEKLRKAGLPKRAIRSYALIGFDSGPDEAWIRCAWIESHGIKALPMWFHPLDALKRNKIYGFQEKLGWNDLERKRIMQWYYQHNLKYGRSEYQT